MFDALDVDQDPRVFAVWFVSMHRSKLQPTFCSMLAPLRSYSTNMRSSLWAEWLGLTRLACTGVRRCDESGS
jgi:hypothetical protein